MQSNNINLWFANFVSGYDDVAVNSYTCTECACIQPAHYLINTPYTMKTFKSLLNESRAEDRNQFHIIVIGNDSEIENTEEGKWQDSKILDYWKRVEKPNTDSGQLLVHIGRQKHVNTKSARITWHVNGVKHDKQAFNDNANGITTALNIAKAVVKLPADKTLEALPNENAAPFLTPLDYLPSKAKIFVFKVASTV